MCPKEITVGYNLYEPITFTHEIARLLLLKQRELVRN